MPTFEDRSALVIGGSSGMGLGAARAFAARGGTVTVTSRSAEGVPAAVKRVTENLEPADGAAAVGQVDGVPCDLADAGSVRGAVAQPERLDHLVVSAAPGKGGSDREFFDGKFWGTQTAAEAAAERIPEGGSLLFVSGGLAVRPAPGTWSVSCAFAAVEALARALAVDLAPRRVNCIRPGLFDTGTWADMDEAERERFFAEKTEALPAGRPATPADFGDAYLGLLASEYVTGQVVVVDGGSALLGG